MRLLVTVFVLSLAAATAGTLNPQAIRDSATRAVARIQSSQKNWYRIESCSSCHNQLLPALAFRAAREHGIPVDEATAHDDASKSFGAYSNLDRAVQYTHMIDTAMDDGMRLWAADAAGVQPSLVMAVYAKLIAARQQEDGHWLTIDVRPPQSSSFISATAVSLRALQIYGHQTMAADTQRRAALARKWLMDQKPLSTDERSFQLLGLYWAGASPSELHQFTKALIKTQQADGGWDSVAGRPSDAYSTGQALVALHQAGAVSTTQEAWTRGLAFLLDTQQPDGSWHVKSRIVSPVQVSPRYVETGHPYGHDQFVSLMGESWAILALTDAMGPGRRVEKAPLAEAMPSGLAPWMETMLFGSTEAVQNLLSGGFDANSATKAGTTPLMMAMPDLEKAKLLVAKGADVNARAKSKYSALLVAAQYPGSMPVIRLLMDHGAEVRLPKGGGKALFGATALALATLSGNTPAIPVFRAAGDGFNETFYQLGQGGSLAPLNAASAGDTPTVKALLDSALSVDFAGQDGVTMLGMAVLGNRVDTAALLIDRGASVDHVDSYGLTPLQLAASIDFGDSRMAELLRKSGASEEKRNKDGLTALDLARKYKHASLIAALERRNSREQ